MATTQTEAMLKMVEALEELNSPYLVGGSYASSAHGIGRPTMDIDILAAIPAKLAGELAAKLGSEFYADEQAIRQAIMEKRSFNVIHIESGLKIDVFVSKRDPFDNQQLERRKRYIAARNPDRAVYIATPEDVILSKLRWYRLTNEVSERQWSDVLGVLSVNAAGLDLDYLREWSRELNVAGLLERAITQSLAE